MGRIPAHSASMPGSAHGTTEPTARRVHVSAAEMREFYDHLAKLELAALPDPLASAAREPWRAALGYLSLQPDAAEAFAGAPQLLVHPRAMRVEVVVLSGDAARTVGSIAADAGIPAAGPNFGGKE